MGEESKKSTCLVISQEKKQAKDDEQRLSPKSAFVAQMERYADLLDQEIEFILGL